MLTDEDMLFNHLIEKVTGMGFRNVQGQVVTFRWNEIDGVGRIGITTGDWLVAEGPSITEACLPIFKGAYIIRFNNGILDKAAKAAYEAAVCSQAAWEDADESVKNYWRRAAKAALNTDMEAKMFRRRNQRRYL